jgi:hypothetical protein
VNGSVRAAGSPVAGWRRRRVWRWRKVVIAVVVGFELDGHRVEPVPARRRLATPPPLGLGIPVAELRSLLDREALEAERLAIRERSASSRPGSAPMRPRGDEPHRLRPGQARPPAQLASMSWQRWSMSRLSGAVRHPESAQEEPP